jgi:nitric-oxide synthase
MTPSSVLANIPFFNELTPADLDRLASSAATLDVSPGDIVVREGEIGDRMYAIESGVMRVYTTSFDGSDLVLARLEAGRWFGEQALLPGGTGRRNASVRALEPSRLLAISRPLFLDAISRNTGLLAQLRAKGEEQRALRGAKLRDSVFSSFGLSGGAAEYRIERFPAGAVVFNQGDPGDKIYLIVSGRAEVRRDGAVLANLLPGQFFGEVAILHDAPRSATVAAAEDLELVSVDADWFREAHNRNPTLQSLMESLSSMYLLPRRGLLTLQTGNLDGKPALTAVHSLPDGRKVVSTKLAGSDAFVAQVLGLPDQGEAVEFDDPARGLHRELHLRDSRIVAIESEGEWTGLGDAFSRLLDATPVEPWQLQLFRDRGDFHIQEIQPLYEEREIICACTQTTCGRIVKCIRDGGATLDAVARATGATMVCGGCKPLVRELLGQSDWAAARVVEVVPHTSDIRSFRLRPTSAPVRPHLPGQHLVLQARIDNRWVQRAYTISSAPGAPYYEITVKREPEGVFSRWLFDRLQPDSVLRISEPAGDYCLSEDCATDVVCMAGGIGITPALSMARALSASDRNIHLHVDYSAPHAEEFICSAEFASLQQQNPRLTLTCRVTRRDGRFTAEHAASIAARFPTALYFLCGSEPYMAGVTALLKDAGVPADRIRIEVFTVAGAKPAESRPAAQPGCPVPHSVAVSETPATPLEQARAMLRDCYAEAGAPSAFEPRWKQVEDEFSRTGTYRQTYEEIVYGARVAWRNSVKCIGRMFWQGLSVRDFRHVDDEDAMFDAIFEHIGIAYNGGNLRPLMTVFPPADRNGHRPRIWNSQLFRYAAYKREDGSVLGDPVNLDFTRAAMSLGWQPPPERTAFDLLPVVLQAGGRPAQWREIPPHLRYQVPMQHPDFPWFAGLGLKWYAMRIVSLMALDAGGVQYSAIPFNGWSMGTEIGARIFTDHDRYNMLETVARKMGLDTSNDRTLWRDRALVEINIAVLYSYEKAGVKIMDHHSASQSFMKFDDMECRAGRPVHARWSWIVPPISGSITPVYHKDWPDIELKPNYVAQPEPWK